MAENIGCLANDPMTSLTDTTFMRKKPTVSDSNILQAAVSARRSTVYLWMLDHYDAFNAAIETAGRPNWQALSKAFEEEGLRDLNKKAPSPEATRQTWFKVRKSVEKKANGKRLKQTTETTPAVSPLRPEHERLNASEPADPSTETRRFQRKSVTLRGLPTLKEDQS